MTLKQKAEIILQELDKYIIVDWNFKDIYLKAIEEGLKKINEIEKKYGQT